MKELNRIIEQVDAIQKATDERELFRLCKDLTKLSLDLEQVVRKKHFKDLKAKECSFYALQKANYLNKQRIVYFLHKERKMPFIKIGHLIIIKKKPLSSASIKKRVDTFKIHLKTKPSVVQDYAIFKLQHANTPTNELIQMFFEPIDESKVDNKYILAYKRCVRDKAVNAEDRLLLQQMITARKSGLSYREVGDAFDMIASMARTVIKRTRPILAKRLKQTTQRSSYEQNRDSL